MKNNTMFWIVGIIILLVVLNYFGIIDLSQILSVIKGAGGPPGAPSSISGGGLR